MKDASPTQLPGHSHQAEPEVFSCSFFFVIMAVCFRSLSVLSMYTSEFLSEPFFYVRNALKPLSSGRTSLTSSPHQLCVDLCLVMRTILFPVLVGTTQAVCFHDGHQNMLYICRTMQLALRPQSEIQFYRWVKILPTKQHLSIYIFNMKHIFSFQKHPCQWYLFPGGKRIGMRFLPGC